MQKRGRNPYEYLVHDRDSIFSCDLDESVGHLGLKVLKTPRHCRANLNTFGSPYRLRGGQ